MKSGAFSYVAAGWCLGMAAVAAVTGHPGTCVMDLIVAAANVAIARWVAAQ